MSASDGCSIEDGRVQCTVGDLDVGASTSVTVTTRLEDPYRGPALLENKACVRGEGDPNDANDCDTVRTPAKAPVAPVPTLAGWTLLLLAGLLAIFAAQRLRRRRRRV